VEHDVAPSHPADQGVAIQHVAEHRFGALPLHGSGGGVGTRERSRRHAERAEIVEQVPAEEAGAAGDERALHGPSVGESVV
jgi:hypothetical protein